MRPPSFGKRRSRDLRESPSVVSIPAQRVMAGDPVAVVGGVPCLAGACKHRVFWTLRRALEKRTQVTAVGVVWMCTFVVTCPSLGADCHWRVASIRPAMKEDVPYT